MALWKRHQCHSEEQAEAVAVFTKCRPHVLLALVHVAKHRKSEYR